MGDGHGAECSEREDSLGAGWERHRPAVFGVAYRLLGSVADAEDVVQDVWLRAAGADLQGVGDLRAWLVTVAARRSYDILRSARSRRETRARRRVAKAKQSTPQASKVERERLLAAFRAAYEAGDLAGLVRLLHPDAVYVTDGGGKVSAARKPIHGGERVAEVMVRVGRQWRPDRIEFAEVGGELALVFHREGRVYSVDTVQITGGLITAYRRVVNPDKLVRV